MPNRRKCYVRSDSVHAGAKEGIESKIVGGQRRGRRLNSWGEVAHLWDLLQGERGDRYRQEILVPAIIRAAGGVKGKRVLDLGCGNGCVARGLAEAGAQVCAIDKFPSMIEVARSYGFPGITYLCVDVDRQGAGKVWGGGFDLVVACFVLQDCRGLRNSSFFIAENLADTGRAIVVAENAGAFSDTTAHSASKRYWIESRRWNGRGRRQAIVWHGVGGKNFCTVTRYWAEEAYVAAAASAGLGLVRGIRCMRSVSWREGANPDSSSRAVMLVFKREGRTGVGYTEIQRSERNY